MNHLKYLIKKVRNAWISNTLWDKSFRFFGNQVSRYIIIPIKSLFRSTKNLQINLTDGYKDHRGNINFVQIKPEQIARIIKAYKRAKLYQAEKSQEFKIKGLWDEWLNVNFKELISALENEDIKLLGKLFNNIIREQCTLGLGGYDEWLRFNRPFGKSYIKEMRVNYYKKLIDLQGDQGITFPKVGNPCGIIYKQNVIPIESLRHAYRAQEIKNCLSDLEKKVIVEIGGGYGGLGFQLAEKFKEFKDTKFMLFDIPEVLAISSAFLITSLPNKKIKLYGEVSSANANGDFEVGIFPHFEIDELENSSVHLFYNSCSFSEMDEACSRKYLSVIERCCLKYFMHDNHDNVFSFRQADGSVSRNVIGSKLIPDPSTFKLIY